MKSRRISILAAGVVLVGALSAGSGASAIEVPPLDLPLPEISLEEVENLIGVEVPPAGVGLVTFVHFPVDVPLVIDDVPYTTLTLDVTQEEGVTTRNATPGDSDESTSAPECSDGSYTRVGKQWHEADLPVTFAVNRASIPDYMSPWLTTRSLREAHHVWAETNSKCNEKDAIDFSFNFIGYTNAHIGYDQTNSIDFGPLDHPVAISYVWYTDQRIREVDMRLNTKYMWTNRAGAKRYNVKNVAAHEIGHHLGLDDLNNQHGSLTMYGLIAKGEMRKTTLGRGDVRGAQVLTP